MSGCGVKAPYTPYTHTPTPTPTNTTSKLHNFFTPHLKKVLFGPKPHDFAHTIDLWGSPKGAPWILGS